MSILAHIGFTLILFLALLKYLGKDVGSYDFRLLAIGAMLPDIIDKPLCWLSLAPGRGYSHTLLFMLIILALSLRFGLLELAFGNFMHLMLDMMFLETKIFLWPLEGSHLEVTMHTASYYWDQIFTSTFVQVTELMGLICILIFARTFGLFRISALRSFILKGRLTYT